MQPVELEQNQNSTSRHGVQVLERAAFILRALQNNPEGLTLGEISKACKLPRSTVQRIIFTLLKESYVIPRSTGKGYCLGPALIPLGSVARFSTVELIHPWLKKAAEETEETVDLSVISQDKMLFIDQISTSHRLAANSSIGASYPMFCTANGKAALALLNDDELNQYKNKTNFNRITDNTITSWTQLKTELQTIQNTKLAYDNEENSPGIVAIAIAIRISGNEIIAVSIPTPTIRFKEKESTIKKVLLQLLKSLEESLSIKTV